MEIYEWRSEVEGCRWLTTVAPADLERLNFEGVPVRRPWTPPSVEWILDEEGDADRAISDCPNLTPGAVALSARAAAGLGALLEPYGELLPLAHPQHTYFAVNVTRVVDGLDERSARFSRFPSSGRIMAVQSYSFRPEALKGELLFKDSRLVRLHPFVTKDFVDRVADLGLTGFAFKKVWSAAEVERRRS